MSTAVSLQLPRYLVVLVTLALTLASLVPLAAPARVDAESDDLFISEYIEGSGFNKAIEIYNGTGAAVNLGGSGYQLELYSNGADTATATVALSGTLAAGDVYVVARSDAANSTILAQMDLSSPSVVNFNGNDAVALRRAGTIVDVFGQIGSDVIWGSAEVNGLDHTLVRNSTVTDGDPIGSDAFDPTGEWTAYPQNTVSFLGSHTVSEEPVMTDPSGTGAAEPTTVEVGGQTLLTVAVTPGENPASTGIAVTADLTPIGGDAAQPFRDDGLGGDATPGDGRFSQLVTVGDVEPGDKVITVTISDAEERDAETQITLTVLGAPTEVWEIQDAGHLSPYDGEQVFDVEGVVTAIRNSGSAGGFWMTDPTPDGDAATSDGIFVFRPGTQTVTVGQLVHVTGTVDEFRPGGAGGFENLTTTQIVSPTVEIQPGGPFSLPTTVIGVDRLPPTLVIDDDSTGSVEDGDAVYDPANDGIDFWESLEGMRLRVADAVAVGPRNSFGEIAVISQHQVGAGVRTPRGGILVRDPDEDGDYRAGDFNPERLILDDVLTSTPSVNTGDEFGADPVGVLDYGFGNFKLYVTANPGRVDNGLVREATTPPGPRDLSIATYNVENLTVGDPQAKFDSLANQIVDHLKSPDLIGIEEMQDDSGAANDGTVSAAAGWNRLIAAIVAAGGPLYEYRSIDPINNDDGGAPGANIRVGFLYRTDRGLEFVDRPGGDAVTDTDVVATPNGTDARLTVSPGRVLDADLGGAAAFEDTRKSLVGEFRWRGETLFVVVNHFSSKGDDHPLFGHFQPPARFTEFQSGDPEDGWRHAQAQAVNDFVDEILAVDAEANVVVLGDVNDFDFSETVGVLTGERVALAGGPDADGSGPTAPTGEDPVLLTLFDGLPENERYSYVFDGNSQVLDQILVSPSLWQLDPAYDVVHVNAEFAVQTSDHDPSVMRVSFQPRRGG